jgi:phage tail sheath protein FI
VRRTTIMIAQSVCGWLGDLAFAPNDANTWAFVKSGIERFLTGLWQAGGLQGASPADAFAVQVGLGSTMTGDDMLDGLLRVSLQLAIVHPAEFIVISIEQPLASG